MVVPALVAAIIVEECYFQFHVEAVFTHFTWMDFFRFNEFFFGLVYIFILLKIVVLVCCFSVPSSNTISNFQSVISRWHFTNTLEKF